MSAFAPRTAELGELVEDTGRFVRGRTGVGESGLFT
jgi:hypothetical protein